MILAGVFGVVKSEREAPRWWTMTTAFIMFSALQRVLFMLISYVPRIAVESVPVRIQYYLKV